jgi:hypothetical protein
MKSRRRVNSDVRQLLLMCKIGAFLTIAIAGCLLAADVSASPGSAGDRALITVVSRDSGMVCNTNEYVELRVMTNGAIDGDVLSQDCKRTRKSATLRANQLEDLVNVLRDRRLLFLKTKYRQFMIYTDTGVSTTITLSVRGKEKKIALMNPDPDSPVNRMKYPRALIKLLLEIKELRKHLEILGK